MTPRSEFLQALLANANYADFAAWSFLLSAGVFLASLALVSKRHPDFAASAMLPLADETPDANGGR